MGAAIGNHFSKTVSDFLHYLRQGGHGSAHGFGQVGAAGLFGGGAVFFLVDEHLFENGAALVVVFRQLLAWMGLGWEGLDGTPILLVLDNYDSFTWNAVQYPGELGAEVEVFRNDEKGRATRHVQRRRRDLRSREALGTVV